MRGFVRDALKNFPFVMTTERFIQRYWIVFTLIVLYTVVLIDISDIVKVPRRLKQPIKDPYFRAFYKFVAIFSISLTASKDIETALASTVLFAILINVLRDPDERNEFPF